MSNKTEAVLFDLDGTIIDSYKGIQQAFDKAYLKVYDRQNEKSIKTAIGPPIGKILSAVTGETNIDRIEAFVKHFKYLYDSAEYKTTSIYEDMEDVLKQLFRQGIKMYIVTNKRCTPTRLILKYLSLQHYFSGIYCSDTNGTNYPSKCEMVEEILKREKLHKTSTLLIGDTNQDEIAAKQNEITFIYAAYGFGNLKSIEKTINKPIQTLNFIN